MADTVSASSLTKWKKIIDIDELGRKENKSFRFATADLPSCVVESDQWRLLLHLSIGGSDKVVVREIDIDKGSVVEDGFCTAEGKISMAWLDASHVLINHDLGDFPKSSIGWSLATCIWERGTPLSSAKVVFEAESTDSICLPRSFMTKWGRQGLLLRAIDLSTFVHYLVSLDGSVEELPLPRKVKFNSVTTTCRHIITSLQEPTQINGHLISAGTILAYDMAPGLTPDERVTVVYALGEGEINAHAMQYGLKASSSTVYLVLTTRGGEQLIGSEFHEGESSKGAGQQGEYSRYSWICVRRDPIKAGSHVEIVGSNSSVEGIVLRQSGLLEPATIWLKRADDAIDILHQQQELFQSDKFVLEMKTARSKDSTEIDYFVLRPKSNDNSARGVHTLMTGYGAFGVSFPMDYLNYMVGGISIVPWLESGGALVIPLIRGGGERGEDWSKAAKLEKRQNSYDDFAAVAMQLIDDGFTNPDRLGVFGVSNGGLLAAVMGTQRPDLFSAIVSDVPLTDMLRYTYIGIGAAWIFEFGDPADPKMEPILRSYSPFHLVTPDQKLPDFLVTISTKDDRVGAGHARKLVAKLQHVQSPNAFLLEDREGGHAVSDSFKNVDLMSRRIAFFMDLLLDRRK